MEPFHLNPKILKFLSFSLFLMLILVNCNEIEHFLEEQSSILLQLKLGFTSIDELDSWQSGTDYCNWECVKCDEFRRVIGLDLQSRNIAGKIDPILFNLTSLCTLNLSDNEIDEIPDYGWGNLANLSSLNISWNSFIGRVPADLSLLTKLNYLDLSFNFGLFVDANASNFRNTRDLKELYLDYVYLSEIRDEWFYSLVNCSTKLEVVSMRGCYLVLEFIDDESKLIFPKQILQLKTLKYLDISINSDLSGSLPDFYEGSKLETLYISGTNLSGTIPDSIGNLKFLIGLDLSYCQLSGTIPASMGNLSKLEILVLSYNNCNDVVGLDFIKNFKNLRELDLSNSRFSLSTWDADDGSFSSFIPNITDLRLGSCNLTKIPAFIEHLYQQLMSLDLSNNRIHGEIPHWSWRIQWLNLSCNFFTHVAEPSFNVSHYDSPSYFDLHSNMLQGHFPHLPAIDIEFLDLSNNNFTSFIPSNISSHPNLAFLILQNNNLTGEIPTSICNLTRLQVLDLSNNMLAGSIPICLLEKGVHLEILILEGNQFNGVIPHQISPKCKIKNINLRDNYFEGILPRSLSNCRSLDILDLGNNNLMDAFPYWLGNMSSLRVLILRSNKFYGLVGHHAEKDKINHTFSNLHVLDISSNNFSGNLFSQYFNNFKSMMEDETITDARLYYTIMGHYYNFDVVTIIKKGQQMSLQNLWMITKSIDFSNNYFEGEIPISIGQLVSLQVLNLSQNYLTGEIPPQLGKLSQLESLDLSMNSLVGKIPNDLASLSFLSCLNLSYNKLVGQIPSGRQFSTFSNTSFEGNEGLCLFSCNTLIPIVNNTIASARKNKSYMIVLGILFGVGFGLSMAIVIVIDGICCDKARKRSRRYICG